MQKSTTNHTTLLLVLLDGTHRTTQWTGESVNFPRICQSMADTARWLKDGNQIISAVLACGQQVQMYSEADVKEFVASVGFGPQG